METILNWFTYGFEDFTGELFTLSSTAVAMWIMVLLTIGVVLVNGWTDAPNAIATCVGTRCLTPRLAILMAAIFNFLGVLISSFISSGVASSIANMAEFGDITNPTPDAVGNAKIALAAAMVAIVVWAVAAWAFGIPTSESHALIAGITGAALGVGGNIIWSEWGKIFIGLAISLFGGFFVAFGFAKLVQYLFRFANYKKANDGFRWGQIGTSAGMAFMHGWQDGQKFMGVFMLASAFAQGRLMVGTLVVENGESVVKPEPVGGWVILLISVIMCLGTSIGGMKIIKSVGLDMVKLEKYQGFSADLVSTTGLLACSVLEIPVSTTHVKTTSIMGVGAARRIKSINFGVVKEMILAWVLTFPGCGLIGFGMSWLFQLIF